MTVIPLPFPPPEEGINPAAMGALVVPLVLVGLDRLGRPPRRSGVAFLAVSLVVLLVAGATLAWIVASRVQKPPVFDFIANWLPARAAAHGLNFYDPASYRGVASNYGSDFKAEILDVGFWYPPPTMLFMLPMGVLSIDQAAMLWYVLLVLSLAACLLLLWRTFFPGSGPAGLLGCAALVLLLRSTFSTLGFAQTNFLELLWLVAFWRDRDRARGGLWLAFAAVTKPFALVLVAFLAIRRRWAGMATAFATHVVSIPVAFLAFGAVHSPTYFRSNPASRLPAYVYSQDVNQSLWGTLLRMRDLDVTPFSGQVRNEMLVAAGLFLAPTAWAAFRRGLDERLLFGLVLVSGLVLYPVSLEHYSVVLLLPLLLVWARPDVVRGSRVALNALIVMVYVLIGLGYTGVFWAYAMSWVALVAAALGVQARPVEA